MAKTEFFAKGKESFLKKLFGAAVLLLGLFAFAGTKAKAANEVENNGSASIANTINVNEEINGNLTDVNDKDWYKFTVNEPGELSLTFSNGDCIDVDGGWTKDWVVKLYGDAEEKILLFDEGYDGGDSRTRSTIIKNIAPGTYYIKITGNEYYGFNDSIYGLKVNYESSIGKNVEKEDNGSVSRANEINVNQEYSGRLSLINDIDWYKFTVNEPGELSLTFSNDDCINVDGGWTKDWVVKIFGDEEEKLVCLDTGFDGGDSRTRSTVIKNIAPGTYYLKISGNEYDGFNYSEYGIVVNFESSVGKDMEQESNDTPSTANLISVNKNYSGRVSLDKDLDWYAFDLAESSTVTVTLSHDVIDSSNWYWNVRVYDNAEMTNELLNCHWVGNKEKQTSETEIKAGAGRYYMLVERANWSDANYNVCVNTTPAGKKTMLRLYNPNSGEHFYTASEREKNALVAQGWSFEGKAWDAPEFSNTPVYRLYNKNSGDHHYTPSKKERDNLVKQGWKDEGIGWYSDDSKKVPLYRLYNPNAVAGSHHYTTSARERDNLVKQGWRDENIGWYGL